MKYAFPELRTMDIAAHVIDEEFRMMHMDDRDRPLSMAIEGVGDFINKIWEAIKKILSAIPNLCKKLIEKIKDSKLVASKHVNKAEDLPASASNLSADKLAKFKNYRAEIDSRRKKLMHSTRDVCTTALKNCDELNSELIPVLNTIDDSNFFNLQKNTKYAASSNKIENLYKDMQNNAQALQKIRSQAESLQSYLIEFKNEVGDERMFGEWVPNYSGDDDYESIINDLEAKCKKYKDEVVKHENRFKNIFRKPLDAIRKDHNNQNSAYILLEKYQDNIKHCNSILQAYSAVATVVFGVYTQGVSGDTEDVDKNKITSGSSGWVWNDSTKGKEHWDYKAMVRLKSGKKVMLTYAYNQEKNKNQEPTRDIEQVKKDIINDYNTHRANGDPAEEVIGEGGVAETKSDIKNAANKFTAKIVGKSDDVKNLVKEYKLEAVRNSLSKEDLNTFDKLVAQKKREGYEFKGYKDGTIVFVDKNKDHIEDSNIKDTQNNEKKLRDSGYSDDQIAQYKADVANGDYRDSTGLQRWMNKNTPQNKPNQQSSNNQQQQAQASNTNNTQNGNNQDFENKALNLARSKGFSEQQVGVLKNMIDSKNITNAEQLNKWIEKNEKNNNQQNTSHIDGYNKNLSKDDIQKIYDYLDEKVRANKLTVRDAKKFLKLTTNKSKKNVNDIIKTIDGTVKIAHIQFMIANHDKLNKNKPTPYEEFHTLIENSRKELNSKGNIESSKDAAYLTDEQYDRALEYMYDYGMEWEDAVEAVFEDIEYEESSYIDAAVESLFQDDFDYDYSYEEEYEDEDKWDNFLT